MDDQGYYTRSDDKSSRIEAKTEAKDNKYMYRLAKVDGKTQKTLAVAEKRKWTATLLKWLVILLGLGFAMSYTGFGKGILTKFGGFMGG